MKTHKNKFFIKVMRKWAMSYGRSGNWLDVNDVRRAANKLGIRPESHGVWGMVLHGPFEIVSTTKSEITGYNVNVYSLKDEYRPEHFRSHDKKVWKAMMG